MPYDSKSGSEAGKKGNLTRWKDKDPASVRRKKVVVALSDVEYELLAEKAGDLGISRTELVVRAVNDYKNKKRSKK